MSAPDWHIGYGHLSIKALTGRLRAEQLLPQGCSVGHCPGLGSVEAEQLRRRAGQSGEDSEDFRHWLSAFDSVIVPRDGSPPRSPRHNCLESDGQRAMSLGPHQKPLTGCGPAVGPVLRCGPGSRCSLVAQPLAPQAGHRRQGHAPTAAACAVAGHAALDPIGAETEVADCLVLVVQCHGSFAFAC